jgi:hypothetical protein
MNRVIVVAASLCAKHSRIDRHSDVHVVSASLKILKTSLTF